MANPTMTQATTQAARNAPRVVALGEQPVAGRGEGEPDQPRRGRRRGYGCSGSRRPSADQPTSCRAASDPAGSVSLASPGRASPRDDRPVREGGRDRVAQGRDRDDLAARRSGDRARPAAAAGTIARPNPSRAASRSRRSRPTTDRSSPSRPTSPIATVPGATGRSRSDEASARASGRSSAGLGDRQAAGEVGIDVVAAEADPGSPAEHGDQQAEPVLVHRRSPCAPACRSRLGLTSAWTSTSSGRLPSSVGATTLPGAGPP